MKKLELFGVVAAIVAVIFAAVNGGTDVAGALAFAPTVLLAALQRKSYAGAWQFARVLIFIAAILGAGVATFGFGLLAGMLRDTLPTLVIAGYAAAAGCGFVMFVALLDGGEKVMHTGVYRYNRPHARR